jgi:hypothetical protein
MTEEWKKIEPNVWKPENDGDEIEGVLISVEPETGTFKSTIYHLEKGEEQWAVWGTTVLDDRMQYVHVGEKFKIIYKGLQKNTKGQDVKIFEVFKGGA